MNSKAKTIFYLDHIFVCFVLLTPFVPIFGVIDRTGPQFYYLSISQLCIYLYLFLFRVEKLHFDFIRKNKIVLSYTLFLIVSLFSFVFSININESIVEWNQYFTLFNSLVVLVLLLGVNRSLWSFIFKAIILLLSIEALNILFVFIHNFDSGAAFSRLKEYQGLSSNQNIGAFALVIKIPFLLHFILKAHNKYFEILLFQLLVIVFFDVFIIASRGAILSMIIIVLLFSIFILYHINKINKSHKIKFFATIFLFIGTAIFQNVLYQGQTTSLTNRMSNYVDDSTNYRLDRYKDALSYIIENPIIGTGIGTWKIKATDLGSDTMKEYQVAYHVHNDFLQLAAETGLIGLLSYLLIFVITFVILYKSFVEELDFNSRVFWFSIFLSLIVFFLDSMINFPRIRPYSQVVILYVLAFVSLQPKNFKIIFK